MKRSRVILIGALAIVSAGFLAGTADASDHTAPAKHCPKSAGVAQEIKLKADKLRSMGGVPGKPAKGTPMLVKDAKPGIQIRVGKNGQVTVVHEAKPGGALKERAGVATIRVGHGEGAGKASAVVCAKR